MDSKALAEKIVEILNDKKAKDVKTIDISELTVIADYFVICSGTSTVHIKALADEVEEKMQEMNVELLRKEGYNSARWILLDYNSVVVHIFHEEDREFYNLERLWADGVIQR
ncbi:ribosome silencing factor [Acetivibrio clariflavus]|uniref:Ribosomal silencing factor RsfS n=1 Tax=Acetivibrio clariflavus (strain DSM 19732 / NBRC 101661 / EBR45) TaxID=720554 RepID=G8LV07_ACECE|nr:ribosome silencing factor [Acetivibrio clariflavus]AEV69584.1 iojap-like ribosome-associated protein [Acetivibrio clariflavus DSM 19732]